MAPKAVGGRPRGKQLSKTSSGATTTEAKAAAAAKKLALKKTKKG